MKKLSLLIVALLLMAAPMGVLAQEATEAPLPEPTDVVEAPEAEAPIIVVDESENPLLVIALAVAGVVIVAFGGFIVVQARWGYESLPPSLRDLLVHNRPIIEARVDSFFDSIDSRVALTPNALDDLLSRFSREQIEAAIRRVYGDSDARG